MRLFFFDKILFFIGLSWHNDLYLVITKQSDNSLQIKYRRLFWIINVDGLPH